MSIREILMAAAVWRFRHITVPNFVKIGRSVAEILRFFEFLRWPLRHLGFLKSRSLLAIGVERVETHQHAKFRQNGSISRKVIKISIFQDGGRRHL